MEPTVFSLDRKSSDTFAVGDLTVLKSGGPVMTVRSVFPGRGTAPGTVTVDWFVADENYSATFLDQQLLPAVFSSPGKRKVKTPA